jgi:hypothetical protein
VVVNRRVAARKRFFSMSERPDDTVYFTNKRLKQKVRVGSYE